jgi:hypothetical protein
MGVMLARHEMPAYTLDDDEGHDKAEDQEYSRVDHNVQEIAIILWRVAIGGGIVLSAHGK